MRREKKKKRCRTSLPRVFLGGGFVQTCTHPSGCAHLGTSMLTTSCLYALSYSAILPSTRLCRLHHLLQMKNFDTSSDQFRSACTDHAEYTSRAANTHQLRLACINLLGTPTTHTRTFGCKLTIPCGLLRIVLGTVYNRWNLGLRISSRVNSQSSISWEDPSRPLLLTTSGDI